MKQQKIQKFDEATPETRCVENLQLQEKKQHNDSIARTERQKLKAKAKQPCTLHFKSKRLL